MKATFVALAFSLAAGCAARMPGPKPLPQATSRDEALERAAMAAMADTNVPADAIAARVRSEFRVEQNPLNGVPVKRYIEIAVAVRSRDPQPTCAWGTFTFYQRHAGGGSYDAGATIQLGAEDMRVTVDSVQHLTARALDSGTLDCASPELAK
jgi:hypothetical protein